MNAAAVGPQVHQELSQHGLARTQPVSKFSLYLENPDTYGEEVACWLDMDHLGQKLRRKNVT